MPPPLPCLRPRVPPWLRGPQGVPSPPQFATRAKRASAPTLHARRSKGALPSPPPFRAVRATLPLRGMRKEEGAQARNAGRNAKGTPPSPPFALALPLMRGPPVRALAPSPSPLSARAIRAPCLYGACERGGAGRGAKSTPPLPSPSPVAARSARPLPPGSPHVQRGSAPLCTCGEVGGLSLPPFRARPASVGHAKGEGVTQARNARRRAKGAPPPLCPRPPPLPRGPIVRALTPRFATRAERERPRFAHALKWGALPFPPPLSARILPLWGMRKGGGGGRAKGTRPPVRASPPRFATRAKRGGFPLCTRGELGGSPHVRHSRPASARRACERGPQPPLTPVYAPRRWGSARAPFPPQLGGVRGNRSPPLSHMKATRERVRARSQKRRGSPTQLGRARGNGRAAPFCARPVCVQTRAPPPGPP
jgi:hypothetical protein